MSTSEAPATGEFDVPLPSGRLHVERWGDPGGRLLLIVPGLTANIRASAFLGERLARPGLQVVALELRGRGQSETTPPGTYGWENHARTMLELADALGAHRFAVAGHSLGGAIALEMAKLDASRIERMVLIDIAGNPDPRTNEPIMASAARLGGVHESLEAFLEKVRSVGTVRPWSDFWEHYYRYELVPAPGGGVQSRTNRDAVVEDAMYTGAHVVRDLWKYATMPVLLVRAGEELLPGAGHIAMQEDVDALLREVPGSRLVEIDANHYGIVIHEDTAAAIRDFLKDY